MPVPQTDAPLIERTSLRETTRARIREAIVDGTLAPGERLRDAELERWLGVSRTPIREALLELQRDGLVVARAGRETVVAPLDPTAIRHAEELAAALHALAARLAVPRLGGGDLARLEAANARFAVALQAGDADAALAADDAFHGILVATSGNPLLARQLEQLEPQLRRVERLRFASLAGRESVEQHARILAACAAGDAEATAAASAANWSTLRAHLPHPSR
ncbi:GntR family transcriptional regulator [Homoserinibacter sp. YIM 151385]|uniref:GntR family transcriptional regulator n=1 Tax=Homoserinibacter sp. YIM 151385 TaxID=2985506 RepID=UPI0022F005B4|nr:GntR family transcriptional regulator [Homoserinibacter sp. YIM 151385]WBU39009.1 GntR family transcriptional regulator [Homoserinibacter sp. YIM 151385]